MQFMIFGSKADYGKIRMNDILNKNNVMYIPPVLLKSNALQEILWRIHNSTKLNKFIKLPYKNIWYRFMYDPKFIEDKENVCFIFEEFSLIPDDKEFIEYLKQKYSKARFVFLFSNPIDKRLEQKLGYLNNTFNLLITFDKRDSKKYNIKYFPSHYSKLSLMEGKYEKIDVFFIGAAKGRLQKILEAYEILKQNGLSCDFNIVNVDEELKKYENEITYNKRLSYLEVLDKIQASKCILEIVQNGQVGPTLRTMEAIAYNKKLLTNNASIVDEPFYQNQYISVFQEISDLDIDFLNRQINKIDYNYIDNISPEKLLIFIESNFKNN